jgi:acyl carrier protein
MGQPPPATPAAEGGSAISSTSNLWFGGDSPAGVAVTPPTIDDIRRRIATILDIPEERAAPQADLADLVADSFRLVEMAIEIQDVYDVMFGQQDVARLRTVGDLAALVHSRLGPSSP